MPDQLVRTNVGTRFTFGVQLTGPRQLTNLRAAGTGRLLPLTAVRLCQRQRSAGATCFRIASITCAL
jgi:hypothetical protein